MATAQCGGPSSRLERPQAVGADSFTYIGKGVPRVVARGGAAPGGVVESQGLSLEPSRAWGTLINWIYSPAAPGSSCRTWAQSQRHARGGSVLWGRMPRRWDGAETASRYARRLACDRRRCQSGRRCNRQRPRPCSRAQRRPSSRAFFSLEFWRLPPFWWRTSADAGRLVARGCPAFARHAPTLPGSPAARVRRRCQVDDVAGATVPRGPLAVGRGLRPERRARSVERRRTLRRRN